MNRLFALIVAAAFLLSFNAVARSIDDIKDSKEIVVAVYNNFPPFSYQVDGEAVGIDVDIAKQIAQSLGVKLNLLWMTPGETTEDDFRNYLWKGHIVTKVKADLMMRAPYDREFALKRDDVGLLVNELVHMFAPYHTESWKIVHSKLRLPNVPTMSMFQYHPIGAEIDSIPHFYLSSAFSGAFREKTTHYSSNEEAIEAMKAGTIDAVMGLRSQITWLHSRLDPEKYVLATNAFPLIGKQKWDMGLAVHSEYRALAYEIGDVISQMVTSGEMGKLFEKHHVFYEKPAFYTAE